MCKGFDTELKGTPDKTQLLSEANFVKTEVLLSKKSYFCLTKVTFFRQRYFLLDKSNFVLHMV